MFPYKSAVGFFIIQNLKALALIKADRIYPVSCYGREPDEPIQRLRAITFDLVNRFTKTRRISRALAVAHLRARGAYPSPAGSRPPGTGPKLACARPLSRRKTSPNGHKTLSADSSRHALQLSSYKRPPKRPLTRSSVVAKTTHFQAIWPLQPPQSYGVNGHTGCRRSNQTKQISGPAFPDPCFHTKVPLVCL